MVRAKWQPTEEDAESIQAIARNVCCHEMTENQQKMEV